MSKIMSSLRYGFVCCLILLIASCASKKEESDIFVEPLKMEPMINFWENVYSKWDSSHVVFHDNVYLDVVYRIVPITQGDHANFNFEQGKVAVTLDVLERKIKNNESLTSEEKTIVQKLRKSGGEFALHGISERVRGQRGMKDRFREGLERSHAYLPYFKQVFKANGYPEDLAYLPHVESSFVNHAMSKVGASGMWQFMAATARSFLPMKTNVIDGRLDPFMAAKGAAIFLGQNYRATQSWPLAITSYNHGAGGMMRAKSAFGDDIAVIVYSYKGPRFGFASRNFYAEFLAARRIANDPKHYFKRIDLNNPPHIEAIVLHAPMRLSELSYKTKISEQKLIEINPSWLSLIKSSREEIPSGIDVWLPKGTHKRMADKNFYRLADIQP